MKNSANTKNTKPCTKNTNSKNNTDQILKFAHQDEN